MRSAYCVLHRDTNKPIVAKCYSLTVESYLYELCGILYTRISHAWPAFKTLLKNYNYWTLSFQPIFRFRRAVKTVLILLRVVRTNEQTSRNEVLSWAHDDIMPTKRIYGLHGLSFDPNDYACRKEVKHNRI